MKVVVDTNVFISSFFNPKGNPGKIVDLWKTGKITLCLTKEIIGEYLEVLARLGLADEPELKELADLFKKRIYIYFAGKTTILDIVKNDPEDNRFLECALAVRAKYIITGDKHLLAIRKFKDIDIVTPAEFIKITKILIYKKDGD
ncbi:MAG: putative toxin-antitoxin system toxin component, PIN family [Actinobacteria bacterium]|nr:putative toxin-antitoxin system toxin component, PIN family [Actinomycetota bacterium]